MVVLRGRSAAFLGPEDSLTINGFPSSAGKVDIAFRTLWVEHLARVSGCMPYVGLFGPDAAELPEWLRGRRMACEGIDTIM